MIQIENRLIEESSPPLIIAEMSGNHNQSLDNAMAIVEAAAKSGADALKLQTYTADTLTLDLKEGEFFIQDKNSLWAGESLYSLYQKAYTPWDWHEPLMKRARELGLICFSSPFDDTAVDFLESLKVPAYKIASFEIVDLALIHKAASTGKPMIISTGMANEDEIKDAVETARKAGNNQIVLMKCTSSYPAEPKNSHLRAIPYLKERFGVQVGLSDHTPGIVVPVASVALGATVIEKHFTLDRQAGGVDAAFSLEPDEFKAMAEAAKTAHLALGKPVLEQTQSEVSSIQFRRSLYIAEDMQAGEVLTSKNLRSVRPGLGMKPKHLPELLGKSVNRAVKKGTRMHWDLVNA
ncbi:MAG: pseudaminic acid synthase [Cyanobacteria bacterium P01_H01_bin.74]